MNIKLLPSNSAPPVICRDVPTVRVSVPAGYVSTIKLKDFIPQFSNAQKASYHSPALKEVQNGGVRLAVKHTKVQ